MCNNDDFFTSLLEGNGLTRQKALAVVKKRKENSGTLILADSGNKEIEVKVQNQKQFNSLLQDAAEMGQAQVVKVPGLTHYQIKKKDFNKIMSKMSTGKIPGVHKTVVKRQFKPNNHDDEFLKMLNTKFDRSHLPEGYVMPLEQRTSFYI